MHILRNRILYKSNLLIKKMTFRSSAIRRGIRFSFLTSFKNRLQNVSNRFQRTCDKVKNYETPERFKGTFVERWGKYWRNLYLDYYDTVVSVSKDCKEHPIRASIYCSILGCFYYLAKNNPDECSFQEQLLQDTLKIMLIPESLRNPVAVQHLTRLHRYYSEGVVRRLSLGFMSLIWIDNYDKDCSLYKAVCPYLKPRYLTFYGRVVDIGILEKWWILDSKMQEYDINEEEYGRFSSESADNNFTWRLSDMKKKLHF